MIWKYSFWIALINVYLTGNNAAVCGYLNIYVWFVMWYALFILWYGSLPIFGLLFSKSTLHNSLVLLLVTVRIACSSLMMWKCLYVKTALHTTSQILHMDINELCVSPAMICPSISVLRSFGNANVHPLVDIIFPPFGSPTVIVFFDVVCSWG